MAVKHSQSIKKINQENKEITEYKGRRRGWPASRRSAAAARLTNHLRTASIIASCSQSLSSGVHFPISRAQDIAQPQEIEVNYVASGGLTNTTDGQETIVMLGSRTSRSSLPTAGGTTSCCRLANERDVTPMRDGDWGGHPTTVSNDAPAVAGLSSASMVQQGRTGLG